MGGDDDLDSARQDWSNGGYVDRWLENVSGIMNILCLRFRFGILLLALSSLELIGPLIEDAFERFGILLTIPPNTGLFEKSVSRCAEIATGSSDNRKYNALAT